jgi:hypothetical protein
MGLFLVESTSKGVLFSAVLKSIVVLLVSKQLVNRTTQKMLHHHTEKGVFLQKTSIERITLSGEYGTMEGRFPRKDPLARQNDL